MSSLPQEKIALHWFRRDLRWHDNRALHAALDSGHAVLPFFVFDRAILDDLNAKDDSRVTFLHDRLTSMDGQARAHGSGMWVEHGHPLDVLTSLCDRFDVAEVHTNEDYEPYASKRDANVREALKALGVAFHTHKDHVVKAPGEVTKPDGLPYTVFTPYSKRWHANLVEADLKSAPSENHLDALVAWGGKDVPSLQTMGFSEAPLKRLKP